MGTMSHFDYDDITNSLISELEATNYRYRVEQEIAERKELLQKIEDITGPSKRTLTLIKEIDALEELLQDSESDIY